MASGRIHVVIISGSRERLQMAAMVASVGSVSGNEVGVFLSMNALPHFVRGACAPVPTEGEVGVLMEQKQVPPFKELFGQAVELGNAKIFPCSMAMDILGIKHGELEPYVGKPMGLTKFLDEAADGQVWSF